MKIGVVIPCYKVSMQILAVIGGLDPQVDKIYVVDDCCPEQTGEMVRTNCSDPRVTVLRNAVNLGVGGATKTGYQAALADGIDIVVKLDGDGQMDPNEIPRLVKPILTHRADYTKGNRFFRLDDLTEMPKLRLIGNSMLSLINKLTSGYWQMMDPTNGYTAIHKAALSALPLHKVENRYFFESDMLFRLGIERAVIVDVPMRARYGGEKSNLKISRVAREFPLSKACFLPIHPARCERRLLSPFLRHSAHTVRLVIWDYSLDPVCER